jgi:E3 ubiquitin-protein ligase SHPRH
MPFSAVEQQHYETLFRDLVKNCGLDIFGNPIEEGWDPEDPSIQDAMRVSLDRLRQTVLHPEVGLHNRRALGHRAGPMRTVAEVLDAMLDQSESAIRTEQRGIFLIRLTRGQAMATQHKVSEAVQVWEDVLTEITEVVAACREHLQKETEQSKDAEDTAASEMENEEAVPARITEARRRLRSALEIQHKAVFFRAMAYFTIKSNQELTVPDSDDFKNLEKKESESYDIAKSIRKEILQESHSKAMRLMKKISGMASRQAFAVIPEFKSLDQKGIESRKIVDAFEELCGILDDQANQLDEWRENVIQLLLKALLDEESDDITGEEYEDSTKLQEEIMVLIHVLRTAVADRQDALSGQKNFLVEHEYKVAMRQAQEGEGPFPEKVLELFKIRDALRPKLTPGDSLDSMRAIVASLRALSVKLRHDNATGSQRASAELAIVSNQLTMTQRQLTEQTKVASAMEQEMELFTDAMNARLDFYRQLQAVSDMVADYDGPTTEAALAGMQRQEDNARVALATAEAKHRYCKLKLIFRTP